VIEREFGRATTDNPDPVCLVQLAPSPLSPGKLIPGVALADDGESWRDGAVWMI